MEALPIGELHEKCSQKHHHNHRSSHPATAWRSTSVAPPYRSRRPAPASLYCFRVLTHCHRPSPAANMDAPRQAVKSGSCTTGPKHPNKPVSCISAETVTQRTTQSVSCLLGSKVYQGSSAQQRQAPRRWPTGSASCPLTTGAVTTSSSSDGTNARSSDWKRGTKPGTLMHPPVSTTCTDSTCTHSRTSSTLASGKGQTSALAVPQAQHNGLPHPPRRTPPGSQQPTPPHLCIQQWRKPSRACCHGLHHTLRQACLAEPDI